MLSQCSYIYEDDHRCGRIPSRGETLCRDHRNRLPPRARCDEDAFDYAMYEVAARFDLLPLPQLLAECQANIAALFALIENKASAEERAAWHRASIAISGAIDRLDTAPVDLSLSVGDCADQPSAAQLFATTEQFLAQLQQKLAQLSAAPPAPVSHYNGSPQALNGPPCI
jgi:hypothetical protein